MTLKRTDIDQVVRHLKRAHLLAEQSHSKRVRGCCASIDLVVTRFLVGAVHSRDVEASVVVLTEISSKLYGGAAVEVHEAIALLLTALSDQPENHKSQHGVPAR